MGASSHSEIEDNAVMPGLDPGIHDVMSQRVEAPMEWIAGSSPAMTIGRG
jgi:hypothetical protein